MTRNQKSGLLLIANATMDIASQKKRSAWEEGVRVYALELLYNLKEAVKGGWVEYEDLCSPRLLERALLNGASDWEEYSSGGCALIFDADIAERLCTPSELKKTRNGERRPNAQETWLDTQARALWQASNLVKETLGEFSI